MVTRPPGISDQLWNAYQNASPEERARLVELYKAAQKAHLTVPQLIAVLSALGAVVAAVFRYFGFGKN